MFDTDDFDGFRAELRSDGVCVIAFNRPERHNAISMQTLADLERVLLRLGEHDACGAIVITGEGRSFCSGLDLASAPSARSDEGSLPDTYRQLRHAFGFALAAREIPQPLIAAINGPAIGGGFALTTVADIRVCAPDATFLAPFIMVGVSVGDLGLSWMLPRLIGAGAASDLLLTGRTLGATEAHQLGLVQHLVDDPQAKAIELATQIAAQPRLAVQMSKELLNASIGAGGLREHLELEMRSQIIGWTSQSHHDAVKTLLAARQSAKSASR